MFNRRNFIQKSAQAGAGLALTAALPWQALAQQKQSVAASDKIRVGVIGVNGMGWSNLTSMNKIPEVQVVALCDVDSNVLNWRKYELAKNGVTVKTFEDYRKMLADKDIDVVIIGTPDHWHCLQMVEACAAGKDVYVEKPIGNSIEECRIMEAAQKKYGRAVQVGQWQRSTPHFTDAINFVKSGKLGNIRMTKAWA
ncbi:MAG: Gfo/Idh/MocA family protein [Cyclobacteriaceae bacterium]